MQKLERRNTYTPMGIPHTRSNCDSRAKPAGTCYKNHLNLLNNRIRRQGRYPAITNSRDTLHSCPKVSATL
ncbi:MAG: hypothetical protein OIN86_01820 [Candidatus Methanoperedens sp.]|nr:hypothetical protein [Candidatus Methanoperedens sp.]